MLAKARQVTPPATHPLESPPHVSPFPHALPQTASCHGTGRAVGVHAPLHRSPFRKSGCTACRSQTFADSTRPHHARVQTFTWSNTVMSYQSCGIEFQDVVGNPCASLLIPASHDFGGNTAANCDIANSRPSHSKPLILAAVVLHDRTHFSRDGAWVIPLLSSR